jgi:hypothetical protein
MRLRARRQNVPLFELRAALDYVASSGTDY